jgi:hypothetical protein
VAIAISMALAAACDTTHGAASAQPSSVTSTGEGTPTSADPNGIIAYVDAIMRHFSPTDEGLDSTQGECVAALAVDVVGVDALLSAGVTPANIPGFGDPTAPVLGAYRSTTEQERLIADRLGECMDPVDVVVGWYPGFPAMSAETTSCVAARLRDDQTFRLSTVWLILGLGTDVSNGFPAVFLLTAMQNCGVELPVPTG